MGGRVHPLLGAQLELRGNERHSRILMPLASFDALSFAQRQRMHLYDAFVRVGYGEKALLEVENVEI